MLLTKQHLFYKYFEALESGGKIGMIENASLRNLVPDLYQNKVPSLQVSSDIFSSFKSKQFVPYRLLNKHPNSSRSEVISLFKEPAMQDCRDYHLVTDEVILRYHILMQQSRNVVETDR